MARGMALLAGATREGDRTRIFVRRWEALIAPGEHRLNVTTKDFDYRLALTPQKPIVRHGDGGYSRKGSTPERASCYYSFTRLAVSGTLRIHEEAVAVRGLGWMDQEFSSAYLEPGITGWDWFSLQFDDGSELMLFGLRRENNTLGAASSGSYIYPDGSHRHLARLDFILEPTETWRSPASRAIYPTRWRVRILPLDLDLEVAAAFEAQEMLTAETTGVTYWEGSVAATGTREGIPLTGRGYLEMTGRGGKGFEAPL
jgi:predicted secreted hydrolase